MPSVLEVIVRRMRDRYTLYWLGRRYVWYEIPSVPDVQLVDQTIVCIGPTGCKEYTGPTGCKEYTGPTGCKEYTGPTGPIKKLMKTKTKAPTGSTGTVAPLAPRIKRALLIGVNYIGKPYELRGCIRDAETMDSYYRSIGVTDIRVLTDTSSTPPTVKTMLDGLNWLTEQDGDLFFHFSGHGTLEHERVDPTDCLIVGLDGTIRDDTIREIFATRLTASSSVFACFDVCHNGSGMDLRYQITEKSGIQYMYEDTRYPPTEARIVCVSGCGDSQTCAESEEDGTIQGAMTWALVKALNVSTGILDILSSTTETLESAGYTQRPIVSLGRRVDLNEKAF